MTSVARSVRSFFGCDRIVACLLCILVAPVSARAVEVSDSVHATIETGKIGAPEDQRRQPHASARCRRGVDRTALTVAVINPTESAQRLAWTIDGATLAGTGTLWRMAPSDLNATITVGEKAGVAVEELPLTAVPASVAVPPFSVSLDVLRARAR